jgi:hypothetical protein
LWPDLRTGGSRFRLLCNVRRRHPPKIVPYRVVRAHLNVAGSAKFRSRSKRTAIAAKKAGRRRFVEAGSGLETSGRALFWCPRVATETLWPQA